MKKIVVLALIATLVAPFSLTLPADAAVKKYKTCAALQKKYPYGAGVKGAKDKVKSGFSPVKNFKVVSKSVYNASKKLDTDKDKILCELPKYKNCNKLNIKYKNGAGLKGSKDKVVGSTKPVTNFAIISKYLYNTNKPSLDRDKDGIVCEKL